MFVYYQEIISTRRALSLLISSLMLSLFHQSIRNSNINVMVTTIVDKFALMVIDLI